MKRSVKIITVILGILIFLPGLNKFFEPAHTKFMDQVVLSELPFTTFTYWLAILSEVTVGLALIFLVFLERRLDSAVKRNIFYSGHYIILFMMLVAIYVHIHPDVPAEILPIAKPPYMPMAYLLIVGLNLFLNRKGASNNEPSNRGNRN